MPLTSAYTRLTNRLSETEWLLPTLARFLFAAVFLVYYLNSGLTKLGDGFSGLWILSDSVYIQMFPKAFDAVGYDSSALSVVYKLIALAGTWAEFILPVLIVIGLLTRVAALGMIGFIIVQSFTDVFGRDDFSIVGAWFDRFADAVIMDQRALWVFLLVVLVMKGAGPLSFDRALRPATSA